MDKQYSNIPGGPSSVSNAFIKHESFLKRFLKKFLSCPQDIEDVVQDTYLLAKNAEKHQVIHSPKAFLFRLARNQALKELRKKSRRITDYIEDLDGPGIIYSESSAEDETIARQTLGVFCQAVLEMTPNCRRAFLMCKVYGLSYKEVATQLGISVSGVEKHVARGLMICSAHVKRTDEPIEFKDDGEEHISSAPEAGTMSMAGATGPLLDSGKKRRDIL